MLIRSEHNGLCCSKNSGTGFRVIPERMKSDRRFKKMYALRKFRHYSMHLESIFAFVCLILDLKLDLSRGTLFMRLYGNVASVLTLQNEGFTYLWSNNAADVQ